MSRENPHCPLIILPPSHPEKDHRSKIVTPVPAESPSQLSGRERTEECPPDSFIYPILHNRWVGTFTGHSLTSPLSGPPRSTSLGQLSALQWCSLFYWISTNPFPIGHFTFLSPGT